MVAGLFAILGVTIALSLAVAVLERWLAWRNGQNDAANGKEEELDVDLIGLNRDEMLRMVLGKIQSLEMKVDFEALRQAIAGAEAAEQEVAERKALRAARALSPRALSGVEGVEGEESSEALRRT